MSEKPHRIIKMYSETLKGKEFVRSLIGWCQTQGIHVEDLHAYLMCVVKVPSLDIDYDNVYSSLVEKGYLTEEQHNVPMPEETEP